MLLTPETYFSIEADKEYMSVSQFKNFRACQAKALYDLNQPDATKKEAFLERFVIRVISRRRPKTIYSTAS